MNYDSMPKMAEFIRVRREEQRLNLSIAKLSTNSNSDFPKSEMSESEMSESEMSDFGH